MSNTNIQGLFKEETVQTIEHMEFERLTEQVYGKAIQIYGASNGDFFKFHVKALKKDHFLYQTEQEYMQEAIEKGYLEDWQYGAVFNDLQAKGIIKEGTYLLRVTW